MLVLMKQDATQEQIRDVKLRIGELGFRAHEIPGSERTAIGITGNHGAIAAGADGLMIEVHPDPAAALSDGAQSLKPSRFAALMNDIRRLAPVVGRTLNEGNAT